MKKKVIAYNRIEKPVLQKLQEEFDVTYFENINPQTDASFLHALQQVEGIIGLELPVDKELLDQAPHLKIVSNISVGYNNLDIDELSEQKIMATNTPDVLTDTVADAIFGIMIAAARRIPELDQLVKDRKWITEAIGPEHFGVDVHHKTLGIIGMGKIGQAIAQRAHAGFLMDILYHTRTRKQTAEEKYNATYSSLDTLLRESDFVCLMTPLTAGTEGMIGKREFQLMKKSALFINGSRGRTVVETELIAALERGDIAGAALDVFENEPLEFDNPLLTMKQVVTTPHIGSSTYETELKMSERAAENLMKGLQGKKPPHLINPDAWVNK